MDEARRANWYFREACAIASTAGDVADPSPMHRSNAYAKTARGEDLTDDERRAVAAASGKPMLETVAGAIGGDVSLGFMFLQAPELVAELDALIAKWGERLGAPDFMAWQVASDYVGRALAVVQDEAGIGDEATTAAASLDFSGALAARRGSMRAAVAVRQASRMMPPVSRAAMALRPIPAGRDRPPAAVELAKAIAVRWPGLALRAAS